MYKQDLALNNLQGLICHKTQSTNLILFMIFWSELGDPFELQSLRKFYAYHFLGNILFCAYAVFHYGEISVSCTIPSGSPFPLSHAYSCISFCQFAAFTYYVMNCFVSVTT